MNHPRRTSRRAFVVGTAAASAQAATPEWAQPYKTRPVRLLI